MKKNIVSIICLAIVLIAVIGLWNQKSELNPTPTSLSGWSLHENKELGFSVLLPDVGTVDFDKDEELGFIDQGKDLVFIDRKGVTEEDRSGFKVQVGVLPKSDDFLVAQADLNRFFKQKTDPACKIVGWGDRDVQSDVTVYGNANLGTEFGAEPGCTQGILIKVDEITNKVLLVEYSMQDWSFGPDKENGINIDQQILSSFRFLR